MTVSQKTTRPTFCCTEVIGIIRGKSLSPSFLRLHLLLSGSDLKDAKGMIGHADPSITDRYSHLVISRNLERQEKLAAFYAGRDADSGPSLEHIWNADGGSNIL